MSRERREEGGEKRKGGIRVEMLGRGRVGVCFKGGRDVRVGLEALQHTPLFWGDGGGNGRKERTVWCYAYVFPYDLLCNESMKGVGVMALPVDIRKGARLKCMCLFLINVGRISSRLKGWILVRR